MKAYLASMATHGSLEQLSEMSLPTDMDITGRKEEEILFSNFTQESEEMTEGKYIALYDNK